MRSLKSKKGITLIALVVTLVVMTILTTVTITSTNIGTDFRRYSLMCSDIELLEDKILHFYRQYNELPIGSQIIDIPEEIKNGNSFYEINLNLLNNITLNFGEEEDIYIIDYETFEVYYLNGIKYDGKIYYTDVEGNSNEMLSYELAEKDENGMLTQNAIYKSGNYTAIIPKGFAISSKSSEQTIENGLVIKDVNDNEFVWIPVEKAIVTEAELSTIKAENSDITTDVQAVQKMVNDGTYPTAVQIGANYIGVLYSFSGTNQLIVNVIDWTSTGGYREPVNLQGNFTWTTEKIINGTTIHANTSYIYDSQEMFTLYGVGKYTSTLYQNSYDKMVRSVASNGGFYVGRYEMSTGTFLLENGTTVTYAQSKQNQTVSVFIEWYKMYKYERDYAAYNGDMGVTSEMIWGSQWDQVMLFVNGKNDGAETPAPFYVTTPGSRKSDSSDTKTGMNVVDQVANIFDLEGSRSEWTQEASHEERRVRRGGEYNNSNKASNRFVTGPTSGLNITSRVSLYIK